VTLIVDASVLIAALMDDGAEGRWADQIVDREDLVAPQHATAEAASGLRRAVLTNRLNRDIASLAYADLLQMSIETVAFEPYAERIWELRSSVTIYDAWYVALAEALDVPLATLDRHLANAHGPRCTFLMPED